MPVAIKRKYKYAIKTGRPDDHLIGQKFSGWKVVACAGKLDKKNNYWIVQSPDKKEKITLRSDKLKEFKAKRFDRVVRKIKDKK